MIGQLVYPDESNLRDFLLRDTVVALMNTGEETIKTSVSIADVFTDGVSESTRIQDRN